MMSYSEKVNHFFPNELSLDSCGDLKLLIATWFAVLDFARWRVRAQGEQCARVMKWTTHLIRLRVWEPMLTYTMLSSPCVLCWINIHFPWSCGDVGLPHSSYHWCVRQKWETPSIAENNPQTTEFTLLTSENAISWGPVQNSYQKYKLFTGQKILVAPRDVYR